MSAYPAAAAARDAFVLERRPARPPHDPWQHHGVIVEHERQADGTAARVATVFLTGRECPWRCVMCDLWRYTIAEDTPAGAIPAQVAAARRAMRAHGDAVTQMKLYNAGSFFDPRAVPESDYDAVAARLAGLDRVIVESHPALVGPRVDRLLKALGRSAVRPAGAAQLEVAMGLETAHPEALERLHKRITIERFARAAEDLRHRGIPLRVFLLIAPPFIRAEEQDAWLLRSVDVAVSCGASVVSLNPTRPGNGALEALAAEGLFRAPRLDDIERSFTAALAHVARLMSAPAREPVRVDVDAGHRTLPPGRPTGAQGDRHCASRALAGIPRVFVDVWDLTRFSACPHCCDARRARLQAMNLEQRAQMQTQHASSCSHCGHVGPGVGFAS